MFSNSFVEVLNELSEQVKKKLNKTYYFSEALSYSIEALSYSIEAWCGKLELSQQATRYILEWRNSHEVQDLTNSIWKEWHPKEEERWSILQLRYEKYLEYSKFYNYLDKYCFQLININRDSKNMNIKFILVLAFVATSVGYFLYLLNQQEKEKKEKGITKNVSSSYTDQSPPIQQKVPQFLFLVINARKAEIVETLKKQERIEQNDCETIYRATESLWLGSQNQNKINQKLSDCFSPSNQFIVPEGQESEYDVYLVQIKLKESDDGFKQNVDQLDRIDAFRKLTDLSLQVKVSPRLRVEAYQNTGVYIR